MIIKDFGITISHECFFGFELVLIMSKISLSKISLKFKQYVNNMDGVIDN